MSCVYMYRPLLVGLPPPPPPRHTHLGHHRVSKCPPCAVYSRCYLFYTWQCMYGSLSLPVYHSPTPPGKSFTIVFYFIYFSYDLYDLGFKNFSFYNCSRCKVRLYIGDFSCCLRWDWIAINFPLRTAFAVSHRFWVTVFLFLCIF